MMLSNEAGDRLYETIRTCAYATFKRYRRNAEPAEHIKMGTGPGTYSFSGAEMRHYCRAVIAAVNGALGSLFSLTIPVSAGWTYEETKQKLWHDCRNQLTAGVHALEKLNTL